MKVPKGRVPRQVPQQPRQASQQNEGMQGLLWPDVLPIPKPEAQPVAPAPPKAPRKTARENLPTVEAATRDSVDKLLIELSAEHRIAPAPRLEWSTRMRSLLGRAYVDRRLIRLSAWLDHDQAHETLRHELAHIAVGPARRSPHGARWREWAVRLGANPRATSERAPVHAPDRLANRRYTGLECPGCKTRFVRARVLAGLYCRACGPRKGMLVRQVRGDRTTVSEWAQS